MFSVSNGIDVMAGELGDTNEERIETVGKEQHADVGAGAGLGDAALGDGGTLAEFGAEREASDDSLRMGDEIEAAYQQALQAVEAVESQQIALFDEGAGLPLHDDGEAENLTAAAADGAEAGAEESAEETEPVSADRHARVTPRQIIEAALFVGGTPLTIKRLCSLLREEFDGNFVETTIDSLNQQYAAEQRPYEIAFGEGGYRLTLRSEFERLRNRAYGLGPKEVKLSQEVLEILALVAYQQPISRSQIEQTGKTKPGATLGQLVRRELIAIERGQGGAQDVNYRTTPRFLEVFGLRDLAELPQSDDDLSFK